jgi:tetratricopeptide (TPR) repeat protein
MQPNAERAKNVSWGLGVGLQKTGQGKSFWHWGDNYAFKCYVVAYPEAKTGIVYFTNSVNGLSIARPLLSKTVGGDQPALAFLGYEEYNTPGFLFKKNLLTQAVAQAIQPFLDEQGKSTIKENQMHQIGHLLIEKGKVQQAKEVFALNQQAYPQSPYVYEGYGFACLVNGELTEAAQSYQKSLGLKPDNQEAATIYKGILASQGMKGNIKLRLKGYPAAKLVSVAGSFNNWFPFATFFVKQDQQWVCNFDLPPGQYQYKLIVDGQWMLDPANPATAQEKGYTNSLLIVK